MLGAIAGDIIGSVHEAAATKTKKFPLFAGGSRFTDDTVLTVAVAQALIDDRRYAEVLQEYVAAYPQAGYGGNFYRWAMSRSDEPYGSWGNGSAMRVSPVAYARSTLEEVLEEARRSAEVSHNHPEGIRGAQATAGAVYLALRDRSKAQIRDFIDDEIGYDLSRGLDEIRPNYGFDVSCQGSVPESLISFLESSDYEEAVRNAVSLGGDADTMAAIAGAVAEAFYGGVPEAIARQAMERLPGQLLREVRRFRRRFVPF